MKKLVAIVTNNDDDIYCFRKELIEALIDEGYEILISCPYGPKFELLQNMNYKYDDPIIDRRGMNVFKDIMLFLHYMVLFHKAKPDIILTYTAKPNVYASIVANLLGIPYINNVTGLGSVITKGKITKTFLMKLFKFAYKKSCCVMFQNETNMKEMLDENIVTGKYMVIPGSGVALDRYPIQPYPDGGNGINGNEVIFNYIGRVLHDKGIDDYIQAAKFIKKKYPKTEFNIIGFIEPTENHYEDILKKLTQEGIVIYRGSQQDVRPYIKRSHVIIHPSIYGEGMSNVLLENASSGRPLITTDNAGCREVVIKNKSGFLFEKGNIHELIEKIEYFLNLDNDERKNMGLCGRRYVEEHFSRDIVIDKYIKVVREIVL